MLNGNLRSLTTMFMMAFDGNYTTETGRRRTFNLYRVKWPINQSQSDEALYDN